MDRAYLSKLRRRRLSLRTAVTLGFLALMGVGAFFGYIVFFARADVELEVLGPGQITAGEPTVITVRVVNRSPVLITDGAVTLNLPPGAILVGQQAVPSSPARERLAVDDIPPGTEFKRELRIQFIGRNGEVQQISGLYLYRPENIQSKLTRQAAFSATVGRVPAAITVDAPDKVNAGQELTVTVGVDSETSVPLPHISLGIDFPSGFELRSADPAPSPDIPNLWPLGNLASGTSTKIVLRGVIRGDPEESKPFHVRLGRYDASRKSWLVLTESAVGPTIASPFLLAQASIGGERRGALVPGTRIDGSVLFRNNLSQPVQNVTVTVSFPEQLVELETVQAEGGFYDVTRRMLTWNPASTETLRELDAGEEGRLAFSFTLKASPPIRMFSDKNFRFPITSSVDTGTPPPDFRGVPLVYNDTAEFQISSRLALFARAAYYDSPVPTSGPLPPKVRQATTYTVFLQIGSGANDIRDVSVTALLPGGVEFKSAVGSDVGTVEFNPASREVVWRVGQLAAATGILRPHARATFQIALTPAENQINASPPLLTAINAAGRDSFTGRDLAVATEDVTTELRTDTRSNSQEWRVVP